MVSRIREYQVRGEPDIKLLEPGFQSLLELQKKFTVLRQIRYIDENSDQFVIRRMMMFMVRSVMCAQAERKRPKWQLSLVFQFASHSDFYSAFEYKLGGSAQTHV